MALIGQFSRFTAVGAAATLLQYLLLAAFVEVLSMSPTPASALAFTLSAVGNYVANYHWTFASRRPHQVAGPRFATIAALGLGLNTGLMYALVNHTALHYLLAQVIATAVVLLWNFAANRTWTFAP